MILYCQNDVKSKIRHTQLLTIELLFIIMKGVKTLHEKSNTAGGDTRNHHICALAKAETAPSGHKRRAAAAEKPFERIRDVPCAGDSEILQK